MLLAPFIFPLKQQPHPRPLESGIVLSVAKIEPIKARQAVTLASVETIEPITPTAPQNVPHDNNYTWGNCTWGVANWVSVPNNLGNANTWAARAAADGYLVSAIPKIGAVAQTLAGGLGHVALVIGLKGSQVQIKEMNGSKGLGGIDTRWTLATDWNAFIYF